MTCNEDGEDKIDKKGEQGIHFPYQFGLLVKSPRFTCTSYIEENFENYYPTLSYQIFSS